MTPPIQMSDLYFGLKLLNSANVDTFADKSGIQDGKFRFDPYGVSIFS